MIAYTLRRFVIMIPLLILISMVSFGVVRMQPGEFGSQFLANPRVTPEAIDAMRERYGLNEPVHIQYLTWVRGIITRGDFGYSFAYNRPVSGLIWERLGWTLIVAGSTILFTWTLAIPIGVYSATHQYSFFDYVFSFFGFIGISIPNFFLALLLMYFALSMGWTSIGGLFSSEFIGEPWSIAKFIDLLKHIWIPLIAIGTAGMASIVRQMRGNLLDILGEQYVKSARAKGLSERRVIYKHAVRNAINPLISIMGMQLPILISGTIITSIVLNLPTMGPFFYDALLNHDQYLVMTFLMFSAIIMIFGNLIADIMLGWADPRIRYE